VDDLVPETLPDATGTRRQLSALVAREELSLRWSPGRGASTLPQFCRGVQSCDGGALPGRTKLAADKRERLPREVAELEVSVLARFLPCVGVGCSAENSDTTGLL